MLRLCTIVIGLLPFYIFSQVIPQNMLFNWQIAGMQHQPVANNMVLDVTGFGAVPNDNQTDLPALIAAIDSLAGKSGTIYFPAGTYNFNASINLRDSILIKGAGADSTTFLFNFSGAAGNSFNITGSSQAAYTSITSGYEKNSRKLIIANAASLFQVADEIEIREENGSWDTQPVGWAAYAVGHLAAVDSVKGDTLWIDEALRISLDSALKPEIRKYTPKVFCGFECFKMMRVDGNNNGISYGFNFKLAKNCWIKGIESKRSICSHVALETSSHVSVTESYFHEAYLYDGTSTRGYGVTILSHGTSNLIQNNVFRKLRHSMMVKQGANGNVFGYNYSKEPLRSEPIPDYGADLCLHGHYPFANLFEGNIAQNLNIDIVWGPSGPHNVFFRNKLELFGILMSDGTVKSDNQVFVGNDVSSAAVGKGFYILFGSGHFQHGNNIKGTITPAGTGTLTDTSYYLTSSRPPFWNLTKRLPTIGTPVSFADDNNPARQRFENDGVAALCVLPELPVDTQIASAITEVTALTFGITHCHFEQNRLVVNTTSNTDEVVNILVYNIGGQLLHNHVTTIPQGLSQHNIELNNQLQAGIYLVSISNASAKATRRVVKTE